MTAAEIARIGGVAKGKAHSKAQLRKWGKRGGRPEKLDRKGLATLKRLLATARLRLSAQRFWACPSAPSAGPWPG